MNPQHSITMEDLLSAAISEECYKEIFVNFNFMNVHCLKLLLSKMLGFCIIVGSVLVKLPQVLKIYNSGSVVGLSLAMFMLELYGYSITLAYNVAMGFPFSTWGENLFLLMQNTIIVALFLRYTNRNVLNALFLPIVVAVTYASVMSLYDRDVLVWLQGSTVLFFVAAKLPQIVMNFRNGHTGQLAALTVWLQFLGSAARVFTTIQEVKDEVILLGFLTGTMLNMILALQIVWYSYSGGEKKQNKSKKLKK